MSHYYPYYQDWQAGTLDGARENVDRFPGARTGEALEAYNNGFDYGLKKRQSYAPDSLENTATIRAGIIMERNAKVLEEFFVAKVLEEFFVGTELYDYYGGLSPQLYLDLEDGTISTRMGASNQPRLQRDDGSSLWLIRISGHSGIPESGRHTQDLVLNDFGYNDWFGNVRELIVEALQNPDHPGVDARRNNTGSKT